MNKAINLSIRLPEVYAGALSEYAIGYESPSQTAKRLLMEFLDGKHQESVPTPQALPAAIPSDLGDIGDIGDRLAKVESHWEWTKRGILDAQAKIKDIEHDLYYGKSLTFKEIKEDIKQLKSAINSPNETAKWIQKKPLPEPTVKAEITLTHAEAAKEFDRTVTTIKKWSADPEKWPEGWIFDGDKQLWFNA